MGMKGGDLEDLVHNLISVDEFESKIDDENAIVVGFKVEDKEPAQDLSRFLEKSAVALLDTEVSPAPDEDGKYVVFVEFNRDKEFPANLVEILDSLENLTKIDQKEYKFTVYKRKGEHVADEDTLKRKVRLKPKKEKEAEKKDNEVIDFLNDSGLDDATITDGKLILIKNGKDACFEVISLQSADKLFAKYELENIPFTINEEAKWLSRDMFRLLGPGYAANIIKDYVLISKEDTHAALLLRDKS